MLTGQIKTVSYGVILTLLSLFLLTGCGVRWPDCPSGTVTVVLDNNNVACAKGVVHKVGE